MFVVVSKTGEALVSFRTEANAVAWAKSYGKECWIDFRVIGATM